MAHCEEEPLERTIERTSGGNKRWGLHTIPHLDSLLSPLREAPFSLVRGWEILEIKSSSDYPMVSLTQLHPAVSRDLLLLPPGSID